MHQSKIHQKSCFRQSITAPITSKSSFDVKNQNNNQCLFSILPCGSKSKQLKETLKDQKSYNEQLFQLSTNKHLIHNVKISNYQTQEEKQSRKQCKDYRKGICLTDRKNHEKVYEAQMKQFQNRTFDIKNLRQQRTFFHKDDQSKPSESQTKGYHTLNPIFISRKSYNGQVKLGGKKETQPSRQSLGPVRNLQQSWIHNEKVHTSFIVKNQKVSFFSNSNVKFNSTNHSILSSSLPDSLNKPRMVPVNFNYQINSLIQKQSTQKSLCIFSSSSLVPNNKNSYQHLDRDDSENFKNICVQKMLQSSKKVLFSSSFSNHSQKYRNYMTEQLLKPIIEPKNENDNISYRLESQKFSNQAQNYHLQHNQKSQNHQNSQKISTLQHKPLQKTENKSRSQLIYSSLTVTENRQKQIQLTRNIYNQGYLLGDSIHSNKQLKQLNQNNTFQSFYQGEALKPLQIEILQDNEKLIIEIRRLFDQLSLLKQQEKHLNQLNLQFSNGNMLQLEQKIRQLQTLKQISTQRSFDIEELKQFIRIKKIQHYFMSNKKTYETYLNDQNSWNQYIKSNGDFSEVDFSDQTSETHNQQGLSVEN